MWKEFLQYYWRAQTSRRVHAPFLARFCAEVLDGQKEFHAFGPLHALRQALKQCTDTIEVLDLGAGSRVQKQNTRQIRAIAKAATSPRRQCEQLFRLINWLQPKTMIELGTSLGISTLYQHEAAPKANLYTLEGCPATAAVAQSYFTQRNAATIQSIVGDFETTLPPLLARLDKLDYAFIDGNHREDATYRYFEWCLPKSHAQTVLIFDDIYWSAGMQRAWQRILAHPQVHASIDLFFYGCVFLDATHTWGHRTLLPKSWKPF